MFDIGQLRLRLLTEPKFNNYLQIKHNLEWFHKQYRQPQQNIYNLLCLNLKIEKYSKNNADEKQNYTQRENYLKDHIHNNNNSQTTLTMLNWKQMAERRSIEQTEYWVFLLWFFILPITYYYK